MAKKARFKSGHTSLTVAGIGQITNDNLTLQMYDRLITLSDQHGQYIEVYDEPEAKQESKSARNKESKSE